MSERTSVSQFRIRLMKEINSYIKSGGYSEDVVEAMAKTILELTDESLASLEQRYGKIRSR